MTCLRSYKQQGWGSSQHQTPGLPSLDRDKMLMGFPGGLDGKESAYNEKDLGQIPGSGRSPGEGNGNPFQYCCLGNRMDRGAWQATVHGVTKRQTQSSDKHFHFTFTLKMLTATCWVVKRWLTFLGFSSCQSVATFRNNEHKGEVMLISVPLNRCFRIKRQNNFRLVCSSSQFHGGKEEVRLSH